MSVVELIVGILLLIDPVGFSSGIIIVFGAILMICGLGLVLDKDAPLRMNDRAAKMLTGAERGTSYYVDKGSYEAIVSDFWNAYDN